MKAFWQHGLCKFVAGACAALLVSVGTSRAGDADLELRALIEHQNKQIQDQNRQIEELRKRLDAMLFHAGVAVRHRDGRIPTRCTGRNEQPTTQHHAAIHLEFDFRACNHV